MGRPLGSKNKPKEQAQEAQNDATTQDVPKSSEAEGSIAVPAHKERSRLLEDIVEHNKELSAESDAETETVPETEETKESETQETQAQEAKEEKEEQKSDTKTDAKKKYIVDGQEVEFTDEQITAFVQKHATADRRLAEATRLREDAAKATQTQPAPAPQPSVSTSSATDVVKDDSLIQDVTKAVLYGDEEQVTKAVQALVGRGRQSTTPTLTPVQIQSYVMETLAFERGKQILETQPDQGGYADIWSDPMMREMFKRKEDELRAAKDTRPYAELYKAIGDELRTWRDNLVKQHIPKTGLEDREDAKRATGVIRGAGGKLPTVPLERAPKTHEEILQSMRATRGLN